MSNTTQSLKTQAQNKPSGVAFTKVGDNYISVRWRDGSPMCMPHEYEWALTTNGIPIYITEKEAEEFLKNA